MAPKTDTELMAVVREAMSLPAAQRRAFLRAQCNGDDQMRRRAELLLTQEDSATLIDARPTDIPAAPAPSSSAATPRAAALGRLGAYQLLSVLGEGGMGVVYLAEQDKPRRVVALKVVRPGLITPTLLRRFEHEAEVLARLQHPGIAPIFEAGTTPGSTGAAPIPYFAMEYVKGEPLTTYAHLHDLPRRDRLELLIKVCDAVQHAHAKGVIHRDLKPGNILVTPRGSPRSSTSGSRASPTNPARRPCRPRPARSSAPCRI